MMSAREKVHLEAGHVYRTRDLAVWSSNPPRLAKTLVGRGELVQLAQGLFARPRRTKFGLALPSDEEVMGSFLDGAPFVFTGADHWNSLGLGTTAAFASQLVYNTKYSKEVILGGKRFVLRRVRFPTDPSPEWFVVDLFENAETVGADRDELSATLARAVKRGAFDPKRLWEVALQFGSRRTREALSKAVSPK
jgi:hypothetical protein